MVQFKTKLIMWTNRQKKSKSNGIADFATNLNLPELLLDKKEQLYWLT